MLTLHDIHRPGPRAVKDRWRVLALVVLLPAWLVAATVFATIAVSGFCAKAQAAGLTAGWTKVVSAGFTDPNNSYAPAVTEFKSYLYLSTTANESGYVFSKSHKAGGDIWRTSDGIKWEQVGKPGLGNTHNSSFNFVTYNDKLYAIANNINDHGLEIWVTSDGENFTEIEKGGFGDKNSDWAVGFTFAGRLIIGVANVKSGAQIWVSDDGATFRQVVDAGLGDRENTGIIGAVGQGEQMSVLDGKLYVGTSNPGSGGEIWRTADGLNWERVADEGLGRSTSTSLTPYLVFQNQLYVTGVTGGDLGELKGLDVFRTSDGTTWEKVVSEGFDIGKERNVHGSLVEFQDKLYLVTNTMDPRLLVPGRPSERMAPRGFQLYVSADGAKWTQVGRDGFGASTSLWADMSVLGGVAYLSVFDYHQGSQLWRSTDGQSWDLIYREPDPSFFSEGGGALGYGGHVLWIDNDLVHGLEIWRSDAALLAQGAVTTTGVETTSSSLGATGSTDGTTGGTSAGQPATSAGTGGSGGGSSGGGTEQNASEGGLSGGWIALIAVVAVVVLAALGVAMFILGRSRGGQGRTSGSTAAGASSAAPINSTTGAVSDAAAGLGGQEAARTATGIAARSFCSECGTSLEPGARYCSGCGRTL